LASTIRSLHAWRLSTVGRDWIRSEGFKRGEFRALPVGEESKFRLSKEIRDMDAPWSNQTYQDLSLDLQNRFDKQPITVFQISADVVEEQVRDLFIRLQSGTALTRQQIRDAWPGNLGPYIEGLAGKLRKQPKQKLFSVVDKRGSRQDDEEVDRHARDRQTCAQLLRVFLGREADPYTFPSTAANALDELYHSNTDWRPRGKTSQRFEELLDKASWVFEQARSFLLAEGKRVRKFKQLEVISVLTFLQDMTRGSKSTWTDTDSRKLAKAIVTNKKKFEGTGAKSTAAKTMAEYYEWWRENVARDIGTRRDDRRDFNEQEKQKIFKRDRGRCQVCHTEVESSEAEFDHHPIPWRDGGPTNVDNGRLVHRRCHPRGRPRGLQ
jgi:hypothetical protein